MYLLDSCVRMNKEDREGRGAEKGRRELIFLKELAFKWAFLIGSGINMDVFSIIRLKSKQGPKFMQEL